MTIQYSKLFAAAAIVATFALAGPFGLADTAFAAGKKGDRLPVAKTTATQCNDKILGTMSDECLQAIVEGAPVKPVVTTTVEWRDEDAQLSTLVRLPAIDVAVAEK